MVKIPDKDSLKDHNWNSPRGVANFDGGALAAPGRAMQGLGKSIASLGSAIGGAIDASSSANAQVDKYETQRKFIDFDLQMNDYFNEQERNITPDGSGFREGISSNYDNGAREFFKGVPDALKPEYDYKLRARARDYEIQARTREQHQADTFHTNEINDRLGTFTARMDEEPDKFREWVGRGVSLIEASRLPEERKKELIQKFGAGSESRHIEQRIQRGEDPEEIRKDILQRTRPIWDQPPVDQGGGAGTGVGPRSEGPNDGGQQRGDLAGFLKSRLVSSDRSSHVEGLSDPMQDRLGAFLAAAQAEGHDIKILSGARSVEHQQKLWDAAVKKYGSESAARQWVAPPGKSRHNHGEAVDLQYGDRGAGLGGKKTAAVKWAHENAGRFGLNFPLGNEDWHIEPHGARGGRGVDASKRYWAGSGKADGAVAAVGREIDLPDYRGKGGPASIRYNNPGAMYPGPSSKKYGAVETKIIGGGHKIAVFPDAVSGAAAQFDLLSEKYTGRSLQSAISKWSGGNSVGTYLKVIERETGLSADTILTRDMVSDPKIAIPIAKAMAVQEAGKSYPMSDAQWAAAHQKFSGVEPQVASTPVSQRGITQYAGLSNGAGKGNVKVASLGDAGSAPDIPPGVGIDPKTGEPTPETVAYYEGIKNGTQGIGTPGEVEARRLNGLKDAAAAQAQVDGLARTTSEGQIVTLLDGIPDATPLSAVPPDVRAKIEELAPADALKPRTINGEKIAATDVVTVGDIKAGLTDAMKGPAKDQAATMGAGMALAEANNGLEGRTPKYQYRWLTQKSADKLIGKIETSQRNLIKNQAKGLVSDIEDFGFDRNAGRAEALIDKARTYMTPNQIRKIEIDVQSARMQHEAVARIGDMPEDRIDGYLEKLMERRLTNADPNTAEALSKAYDKAVKKAGEIREMRRRDGARSVETSPEVRQARMQVRQAVSQTATMGQNGSDVGFEMEDRPELSPAQAWETVIDARLEAQERVFGDADDPRIRAVTRREAEQLLKFTDASQLSEDDLITRLQAAAGRAQSLYGKHGARVFKDAVGMIVRGKDANETAAGLAQKVLTGQRVTANDLHRYQLMGPLTGSEAFARSGSPGWQDADGPTLNGLRPMGGQPAPMNPSQPALMTPGNQMQGVQQGRPVTIDQPPEKAVLWLLQNPERNASAFDAKFGSGAAQQVIQFAKQQAQSNGSQGSQQRQIPSLDIIAP